MFRSVADSLSSILLALRNSTHGLESLGRDVVSTLHGNVILSCSLILFTAFGMTRLTKKLRLPNVSAYILTGVLIGPYLFGILPMSFVSNLGFLSDLALAVIALEVGRSFRVSVLKKELRKLLIITLFESLTAGVLVWILMATVFHYPPELCFVFAAIATATAPASTVMTIRQYHGKGPFVDLLLQIGAFDNAICLFLFTLSISLVGRGDSSWSLKEVLAPLFRNLFLLIPGYLSGYLLLKLISVHRTAENRLNLLLALTMALTGICSLLHVSPLLVVMLMSTVYVNHGGDESVFDQLDAFSPPLMVAFFVLSGMNLDIRTLGKLGIAGVLYFIVRIIGKYAGARGACHLTHEDPSVAKNLGLALIPQAGVSIGLAMLAARLLPHADGSLVLNVILSSAVLYELFGPIAAKIALRRAGVLQKGEESLKSSRRTLGFFQIPIGEKAMK